MATLVFTAIGNAIGGPIGGAIGSLVGGAIDRAVIGSGKREGPRLKELAVSTSSYGTPLARQFGTMRVAGSVIWATDLKESSSRSGGKGQPSVTTYSYSAAFAVALSSRPILGVGRIWADGTLLRGAAGDLKVGGALRTYLGHGDQRPDPLIVADRGGACPAFRGLAYCVFEGLALADFGNRIPALTFEVFADPGEVALADLLAPLDPPAAIVRDLAGLSGFSDEGGPLSTTLGTLDEAWPLACDAGGEGLAILAADALPETPPLLPESVVAGDEDSFGRASGQHRRRAAQAASIPEGLRYYDPARDFQAGLQRADGRARPGRARTIELPGAMSAAFARELANAGAERAQWARESLAWRVAVLDPDLAPGRVVRAPGQPGLWRIESWEWRDSGVELELSRLPPGPSREAPADAGEALPPPDRLAGPTALMAIELPPDSGDTRRVYAAASSAAAGWSGAALYIESGGELVPAGNAGPQRATIGMLAGPLSPSPALRFEPRATLEVELVSADFVLAGTTPEGLAAGANRALVAGELLQFAAATRLSGARWRLSGLLRGRGGTEAAAMAGHAAEAPFSLVDGIATQIDPLLAGPAGPLTLAAIGLADAEPVMAELLNPGLSTRPLPPVHARVTWHGDGSVTLRWTRRARGAWTWLDGVDTPLVEQGERYLAGIGAPDAPALVWELAVPVLVLPAASWSSLAAAHPGQPLWVRQLGTLAVSDPTLILTLT